MRVTRAALALLIAGCGDVRTTIPVAPHFPEVQALASLDGVALGMRIGELVKRRPAAVTAPYTGMRELIDGDTVWYHVSIHRAPGDDGRPPARRERLVAVSVFQRFDSDRAADSAWRERVRAVRKNPARVGEPRCSRWATEMSGPDPRIYATGSLSGGATVGAIFLPARTLSGTYIQPAVRTFVEFPGGVPRAAVSDTVDCPE